MELATVNDENPCGDRGLDAVCPSVTIEDTDDQLLDSLVSDGAGGEWTIGG